MKMSGKKILAVMPKPAPKVKRLITPTCLRFSLQAICVAVNLWWFGLFVKVVSALEPLTSF